MKVELFDFDLPEDRIALRPVTPRDASRMLVVDADGNITDDMFKSFVEYLKPGDIVVFNDTKVIPAQLSGRSGEMQIHCNLHKRLGPCEWLAFVKKPGRIQAGQIIRFSDTLSATVKAVTSDDGIGQLHLIFNVAPGGLESELEKAGTMPIPPYIASKRGVDQQDADDYQTIFAAREGAVAAPTASLHFTSKVLKTLEAAKIGMARLTLHVGAGTFLPVKVSDTENHRMHAEWGEVTAETADAINMAKMSGGRIVAVGTTSLRLLESAAQHDGFLQAYNGDTDIFITPGYKFRIADMLLTNFHLPKSTLFMLVAAFSGLETMQRSYRHAIDHQYRFYSYGDASLLAKAK